MSPLCLWGVAPASWQRYSLGRMPRLPPECSLRRRSRRGFPPFSWALALCLRVGGSACPTSPHRVSFPMVGGAVGCLRGTCCLLRPLGGRGTLSVLPVQGGGGPVPMVSSGSLPPQLTDIQPLHSLVELLMSPDQGFSGPAPSDEAGTPRSREISSPWGQAESVMAGGSLLRSPGQPLPPAQPPSEEARLACSRPPAMLGHLGSMLLQAVFPPSHSLPLPGRAHCCPPAPAGSPPAPPSPG